MKKKGSFVSKVLQILSDPSWSHLVHWRPDGLSFVVINPEEFSKSVLPRYFKHSNFSSFIRQLHLYGFKKSSTMHSSVVEFTNPNFVRGREDLLIHVKRRSPKPAQSNLHIAVKQEALAAADGSLVNTLRMQLDELKEQNKALSEDNQSLRLKVDAFYHEDVGTNGVHNNVLDEFFEAGYQMENSNVFDFPPLISPSSTVPSSCAQESNVFDFPQLTRHPSFEQVEMNHGDGMNVDFPETFMNFQDYGMYMEAGEMFYPMQEDPIQPNGFFGFGY